MFYCLLLILFLFSSPAHAVPDGLGNEVFPLSNVGIGTTTPQTALAVTNGNVGIGTWTASSALTVNGTVTAATFIGNGSLLTGVVSSGFFDTGNQIIPQDITDNVGIGTSGASSGKLMVYGGNVGIGTVNQTTAAMLHVSTQAAQNLVRVDDNGDGDATPFIIDAAGNVGIGTSIPQTSLAVLGSVGIGTWTSSTGSALTVMNGNVGIATATPQTNLAILGSVGIGTWTTTAGTALSIRNGNLGFGTATPQTALTVLNGNVGIGTWTADGGNLIINGGGNVGIASAWPGKTLDVNGTVRATAFVGDGSALTNLSMGFTKTGTQILTSTITDNVGIGTSRAANGKLMVYGGNVGIGTVDQTTAATLHVSTQAAQDLFKVDDNGDNDPTPFVISSTGNVGISTVVPLAALDISNGAISLVVGADSSAVTRTHNAQKISRVGAIQYSLAEEPMGIFVTNSTAATYNILTVGGGSNLMNAATQISFYTAANTTTTTGTERMTIDNQGNVGIGTSTPQGGLVITNGNVGIGTWTAAGGNLVVVGSGNVGIGSAWPGQKLDVQGSVRATTFLFTGNLGVGTTTPQTNLSVLGSVGIGTWTAAAGTALSVRNGNVGIGTATPQTDFVVLGSVGIGTWTATAGTALTVRNGNVGIGTASPQTVLAITNGNVGIGTWTAQSLLQVKGSMGVAVVSKASNYTATASDYVILVDASGGSVTITLPAASGVPGRIYAIKKTDSSGNSVIIDPNAAETIDGVATLSTTTQYQSFTIICDGTSWYPI